MKYLLTVGVPDSDIFHTYNYGNGTIINKEENKFDGVTYKVLYESKYLADYQAGRFQSGLYFAKVEEIDD